jgi:hypothetical protein
MEPVDGAFAWSSVSDALAGAAMKAVAQMHDRIAFDT